MIQFLPPVIKRSIEFGCGFGNFSAYIKSSYNAETWGVDFSQDAVNESKKVLDNVINAEAFAAMDVLPLDYFDCIICNDFLEHLECPEIFFSLIRKHLTQEACIVASVPNVRYWNNVIHFLVEKDWKYTDQGILDNTHLRFFTEKSLTRFINENRMVIEVMKGINKKKSGKLEILNIMTLGLIRDMRFLQFGFRARFKN